MRQGRQSLFLKVLHSATHNGSFSRLLKSGRSFAVVKAMLDSHAADWAAKLSQMLRGWDSPVVGTNPHAHSHHLSVSCNSVGLCSTWDARLLPPPAPHQLQHSLQEHKRRYRNRQRNRIEWSTSKNSSNISVITKANDNKSKAPTATTAPGGASSVHAVRGLICTRGQGPRLYTRNGFAVCTSLFLQLCILCAPCVQVVLYRSLAVVLRVKSNSNWFCSTW